MRPAHYRIAVVRVDPYGGIDGRVVLTVVSEDRGAAAYWKRPAASYASAVLGDGVRSKLEHDNSSGLDFVTVPPAAPADLSVAQRSSPTAFRSTHTRTYRRSRSQPCGRVSGSRDSMLTV